MGIQLKKNKEDEDEQQESVYVFQPKQQIILPSEEKDSKQSINKESDLEADAIEKQ